jgi:hypothetical protein
VSIVTLIYESGHHHLTCSLRLGNAHQSQEVIRGANNGVGLVFNNGKAVLNKKSSQFGGNTNMPNQSVTIPNQGDD